MKKKGQIFTLDLLVSIILIVLALGIAMRFFELKEYEIKELSEQTRLERAGNTAAELLVTNPNIECQLTDVRTGAARNSLSNCLNKNRQITKQDIGLSENNSIQTGWYDCYIEYDYELNFADVTVAAKGECSQKPDPGTKNIFAATRQIILTHFDAFDASDSMDLPKDKFDYCVSGDLANCNNFYTKATATIKVWKHE